MSNVLYTCPGSHDPEAEGFDADNTDCGARLFAAPGGTKIKCRHHPEARFIQREDGIENLFLFTEDPGKGAGQGKVSGREGTALGKAKAPAEVPKTDNVTVPSVDVNPDGSVVVDVDNLPDDVEGLRMVYLAVFGDEADRRFREAKLTALIETELERQAMEEAAQKEAQKTDAEIKAEAESAMTENQVDVLGSDEEEEE